MQQNRNNKRSNNNKQSINSRSTDVDAGSIGWMVSSQDDPEQHNRRAKALRVVNAAAELATAEGNCSWSSNSKQGFRRRTLFVVKAMRIVSYSMKDRGQLPCDVFENN